MTALKGAEDIITLLTDYLKEDVGGGTSRINKAIQAENSRQGDSLMPDINSIAILGNRIKEVITQKIGWLVIDITPNVEETANYDTGAVVYTIGLGFVLREDFGNKTFLKSLRMQLVLKNVMNLFWRENQGVCGFMKGEITSLFSPEVVLLGNKDFPKIASGLIYNITIF